LHASSGRGDFFFVITRRQMLQTIGTGALAWGGCASLLPRGARRRYHLRAVQVSPDRVIRTIVGLRPYRPSGFVVRAEPLGEKLLVHDYGHGGAGITLSWGTAHQAVELAAARLAALPADARRAAVLGCGAVGLATARLLQLRGVEPTLYARELPPDTTSNIAGGQWFPFGCFDSHAATPAFLEQFLAAARFSHRFYQTLPAGWGVRWLPNWWLSRVQPLDEGLMGTHSPIRELLPELRDVPRDDNPFPWPVTRRFVTMMIEPSTYLPALLREVRLAGARVVVGELRSVDEVAALPEPVVFNCTGLGSRKLFGDDELVAMRGQLVVLLPQPEVEYAVLAGDLYMFPRADGIVLGGTFERGNESLAVDEAAKARILEGHTRLFAPLV
jgi:glycine/D-amino acid oxidase-like deaminating enzyme